MITHTVFCSIALLFTTVLASTANEYMDAEYEPHFDSDLIWTGNDSKELGKR